MGLIREVAGAISGAATGVAADQWKEFFYCDSLPVEVIAVKGQKRTSGRSVNNKGEDNIISNGSVIAVADGQCMLIVEQGRVVEVCAEPGEYRFDTSTEPSVFAGELGPNIIDVFKNIGSRVTFGGGAGKDQRIYYFNTKELIGNKYGTASPVPFRVVDQNIGLDIDISIKCFGEYSYRVSNPILFYTNVCSNITTEYRRDQIDSQLKTEILTALQPAFAELSAMGIRYSAIPGHTIELANALNKILSDQWRDMRGIEIVSFGVSSVKASEEDEQMIKDLQRSRAIGSNPSIAGGMLAGAQADAMRAAASNEGGAMMGFMGLGMANQAGGMNASELIQMGQNQQMQQQQMQGQQMQGQPMGQQPQPMGQQGQQVGGVVTPTPAGWNCSCGQTGNTGKFCANCGNPQPAPVADGGDGWTCECGSLNKGKFCANCGKPKPVGIPQYKCDKCGWEPPKGSQIPKFCPECGDPFDDGDIVG